MTSPGERIQEARERAGLTAQEVASAAGLSVNWYLDVEHDDGEVTSNLSLAHLGIIARTLGLSPLEIIEPASTPLPGPSLLLSELAARAQAKMKAENLSVEDYSECVGWEMAPVFANPAHLREYTFDALVHVCTNVGVDWRLVLTDATAPAS